MRKSYRLLDVLASMLLSYYDASFLNVLGIYNSNTMPIKLIIIFCNIVDTMAIFQILKCMFDLTFKNKIMKVDINSKKVSDLIAIPTVIIFGSILVFMVYKLITL